MKKFLILFLMIILAAGFAFSQDADEFDEYKKDRDGMDIFLFFATFVVVIAIVLWVRNKTKDMGSGRRTR